MKIFVQLVLLFSTAALLQGCLTCQPGDSPAAPPEETITSSAQVPAVPPPSAAPSPSPEPAPSPEPSPGSPVKDPPLKVVAETIQSPAGALLVTGLNVEQSTIEIQANGQIGNYKLLTLSEPSRLVIDIPDAKSAFKQKIIQIDKLGIAAVRFESHPGYLRIFLDATQWRIIPYRIEETDRSLKIIITAP